MQVRTWFGNFTLDDDRIIDVELFLKDPDYLIKHNADEPLLMSGSVAGTNLRDLAVKYGFADSGYEYDRMLHELSIGLARKQITKAATHDRRIIAAVEAVDDLDETTNILAERLKEWYIFNFEETPLKSEELAKYIIGIKDTGKSFNADLKIMQDFASSLLGLYDTRKSIEGYIRENMPVIAPNLANIAGHILGARLLSIAGSLERLASMPSSTVQVIGAGNALFKHLKGKAPSPKHGLIFRHPLVNTAPKWQRGKIARALASKISLAARYDFYSGKLNETLLEELRTKVEVIRKQHPEKKSRN